LVGCGSRPLVETGVMRASGVLIGAVGLVLALPGAVAAGEGRCDLGRVMGFQVVFGKAIEGYIENGKRRWGYEGCRPDRVVVFADNTGVRCKELVIRRLDDKRPTGFLLGRSNGELKLCVEGDLMDVTSSN